MGETVETVLGMWDGILVHSSFHTDVKELEYKDLLTNNFTQTDHERDKRWLSSVFSEHRYRYADYSMYSTFLTSSPGSVLFSNLFRHLHNL